MKLAFFSLVTLDHASQADHVTYNRWHQLDHRPENLALPGVAWGDRWRRTPADKDASRAAAEHADTDYLAMYWFREPLAESVRDWVRLGEDSFQWGRGPLLPGVRRSLLAFFRPVRGYASRDALVSPSVLPYRPNLGVHLSLYRLLDPHSPSAHEHHAWEDRVLMPRLTEIEGVSGGWTFTFSHDQADSSLPINSEATHAPDTMRLRLLYLADRDPAATAADVDRRTTQAQEQFVGVGQPADTQELLSTTVRTIVPWQDW